MEMLQKNVVETDEGDGKITIRELAEQRLEKRAVDLAGTELNNDNLGRIWYNTTDRQVKVLIDDSVGGFQVVILG